MLRGCGLRGSRVRLIAFLTAALALGTLMGSPSATRIAAASSFANPAFQTRWSAGEAVSANFYGPLATAHDGQQEAYVESPGGRRFVQYFDKARLELTNPATGTVTSGLLSTKLIKGQVQTGDATFQSQPPPSIPIAGDPDNPGPTYAQLATTAKSLFDAGSDHTGIISISDAGAISATTFAVYDATTEHNVPRAFADYRAKAGLLTIGYALCEPFLTTVKVAGTEKPVMIQVFERRVLTYTASNDPAFQVEMGNIGQHYYQWR